MPDYPFDCAEVLKNRRALKKKLLQRDDLLERRIALLSGSTVGVLKDLLEIFLLDWGIRPVFFEGAYGRFYEDAVFDEGALARFKPDVLYIHTSVRDIELPRAGESAADCDARLDTVFGRFREIWDGVGDKLGCAVIQNNFDFPRLRVMGNYEATAYSGKLRFVNRLNERFACYADTHRNFYINDLCWLSAFYGLDRFSDPTAYNAYKYAVAPESMPLLAHSIASIIKALFGKNKKALLLDLDNTLWGGVIGDDGLGGIRLGRENPEGIAYADVQQYASELPAIGILLGVCSKNDDAIARSGFAHPSSILTTGDFATFKANWDPKPLNLERSASELNIGTDSLVLADDNPAERELVRGTGLGVATPELTVAERFAETIANAGYFEVVALSQDDAKRAEMYRQNIARTGAQSGFADYSDYLRSLEMRAYFSPFSPGAAERLTQLANKTNQFNLTTRRYTSGELEAKSRNERCITICGRLEDKFGDNGIVTELVGNIEGDTLDIELWLMSCRVFKRELELAAFDELVRLCRERGVHRITGAYFATPKNALVAEFYRSLGFRQTGVEDLGTVWSYDIPKNYENKNRTIEVLHEQK